MPPLNSNKPTIIIAAYNEERIIHKTLIGLGSGNFNAFQIIVVCNGCTDKTQSVVENQFPNIHCEALDIASKSIAIRHAESLKIGFPRIYLDADVFLNVDDAKQLIKMSDSYPAAQLLLPQSTMDLSNSTRLVKAYYEAWYTTAFVQQFGFGSGAYILNEQARKRFNLWPELISDDGYLRTVFNLNEISIAKGIFTTVKAPKNSISLVKVKIRSKFGNLELKKHLSERHQTNDVRSKTGSNRNLMTFKQKLAYNFINLAALSGAYITQVTGSFKWYRDNSSR